jgi:hypothetical protein
LQECDEAPHGKIRFQEYPFFIYRQGLVMIPGFRHKTLRRFHISEVSHFEIRFNL